MWFLLSLVALSMLVARRSTEKHVSGNVSSLALVWLQQAMALPFIIATLFFAKFYWPAELSAAFWWTMATYVVLSSMDVYFYFKALSIADVSYVAPLMTLTSIGNIVGAYFVLGQVPTVYGAIGAVMIVAGGLLTYHAKHKSDTDNRRANKLALILVLLIVAVRALASNIEVNMLQQSNPTTFNFYSSILSVPVILIASTLIIKTNRTGKYAGYWEGLKTDVFRYKWLLTFIGLTYTINLLATYQAKLIGPNAGYVATVKSASVLPIMLIGLLLFKEKIIKPQWAGLGLIVVGLVLLALNQ